MKSVLIIGGLSTERDQTAYGQFFSEFISDYHFDMANFDELVFSLSPQNFSIKASKLDKEVSEYDLVIFRGKINECRDLAYAISIYLKHLKVPFFNDYSYYHYRSSNKLMQTAFFFKEKANFVDTYLALNIDDFKNTIKEKLKYPFILKDTMGSHGENNFLINNEAELNNAFADHPEIGFIAQPFHPNTCDYRILILGDQKPIVIKRMAKENSHLNNTSQGGGAEIIDNFPVRVIEEAKSLAAKAGMVLAGVDILPDAETGEHFVLEINSQPQILTGAFVEQKQEAIKNLLKDYLN